VLYIQYGEDITRTYSASYEFSSYDTERVAYLIDLDIETGYYISETTSTLATESINSELTLSLGTLTFSGPERSWNGTTLSFLFSVQDSAGGYEDGPSLVYPSADVYGECGVFTETAVDYSGIVNITVSEIWVPVLCLTDNAEATNYTSYMLCRRGFPTWTLSVSGSFGSYNWSSESPGEGNTWYSSELAALLVNPQLGDVVVAANASISDIYEGSTADATVYVESSIPLSIPTTTIEGVGDSYASVQPYGDGIVVSARAYTLGNPYHDACDPAIGNDNISYLAQGAMSPTLSIDVPPITINMSASSRGPEQELPVDSLCASIRPNSTWEWEVANGDKVFDLHGDYDLSIISSVIEISGLTTGDREDVQELAVAVSGDSKAATGVTETAFVYGVNDSVDWDAAFPISWPEGMTRTFSWISDPLESVVDVIALTSDSTVSNSTGLPHTHATPGTSTFTVPASSLGGASYYIGKNLQVATSSAGAVSSIKLLGPVLSSGLKPYWNINTTGTTTIDLLNPSWDGEIGQTDYYTRNDLPEWISTPTYTFETVMAPGASATITSLTLVNREPGVIRTDMGWFSVIDDMPTDTEVLGSADWEALLDTLVTLDGVATATMVASPSSSGDIIDYLYQGETTIIGEPLHSSAILCRREGTDILNGYDILPFYVSVPGNLSAVVKLDTTKIDQYSTLFSTGVIDLTYNIYNVAFVGGVCRRFPGPLDCPVEITPGLSGEPFEFTGVDGCLPVYYDVAYGTLISNTAVGATGSYLYPPLTILWFEQEAPPEPPGWEDPFVQPEETAATTPDPYTPPDSSTPPVLRQIPAEEYLVVCDKDSSFLKIYNLHNWLYTGWIEVLYGGGYPVMVSRDSVGNLYALIDETTPTHVVNIPVSGSQVDLIVAGVDYAKVHSAKVLDDYLWVLASHADGRVILIKHTLGGVEELSIDTGWEAVGDHRGGAVSHDSDGVIYVAISSSWNASDESLLKIARCHSDGTGWEEIVAEELEEISWPTEISMEIIYDRIYVGMGITPASSAPWRVYNLDGSGLRLVGIGGGDGSTAGYIRAAAGGFAYNATACLLTQYVNPLSSATGYIVHVYDYDEDLFTYIHVPGLTSSEYSAFWSPGTQNMCTKLYGPNGYGITDTSVALFLDSEFGRNANFTCSAETSDDSLYRKVLVSLGFVPHTVKVDAKSAVDAAIPSIIGVEDDSYLWKSDIALGIEDEAQIEVRFGLSTITPRRAATERDFFLATDPVWYPGRFVEEQLGLAYGDALVYLRNLEVTTITVACSGGLAYIGDADTIYEDSAIYYELPPTDKVGLPKELHWRKVSLDALVRDTTVWATIPYRGNVSVRYRSNDLIEDLETSATVVLAGRVERALERLTYRNSLDAVAGMLSLERIDDETNTSFLTRMLNTSKLPVGSDYGSTPFLVANDLSLVSVMTWNVTGGNDSVTMPVNTRLAYVHNLVASVPVSEWLTQEVIDGEYYYFGSRKHWSDGYVIVADGEYITNPSVDTTKGIVSGLGSRGNVHAHYLASNFLISYDGEYIDTITSIPGTTPIGVYSVAAVTSTQCGSLGMTDYIEDFYTEDGSVTGALQAISSVISEAIPIVVGKAAWGPATWFDDKDKTPVVSSLPTLLDAR
jgi:hypothetical protein